MLKTVCLTIVVRLKPNVGQLTRWLDDRPADTLACWLVAGWLTDFLLGSLVGGLARWLADWLAGWLTDSLVG